VTSCAIDSEGMLTGQAYVDQKFTGEGQQISIYQGSSKSTIEAPAELRLYDKTTLPSLAQVISRFPK
jgi:glycine hydroxymethyltransferase